ncbi:MAG: hypothetical protein P8181_17170, partial [bacterium]
MKVLSSLLTILLAIFACVSISVARTWHISPTAKSGSANRVYGDRLVLQADFNDKTIDQPIGTGGAELG